MNQISREIEDCLKSIYGDKWSQGLLAHILIGSGRIIAARENDGQPKKKPDAIEELEQNPLAYVRSKSRRVAKILEYDLGQGIPAIVVAFPCLQGSKHIGDLFQVIGAQALERLKESEKRKSRTFSKELMRRAWRRIEISIR